MDLKEKKEVKSTDQRAKLREANKVFTECISKEYLNKFLQGEDVNIKDFCVSERQAMESLD